MELPEGQVMKDSKENGCNYPRALEVDNFKKKKVKTRIFKSVQKKTKIGIEIKAKWEK